MTLLFSKLIDFIVFVCLIYLGIQYYKTQPYVFDLIGFTALTYVAVRKSDINTLTLIIILVIADLIPILTFYLNPDISGYSFYSLLFTIDVLIILTVWLRPFILFRYGPTFIKNNKNIALTHQDSVMAIVFTLHAIFQLCLFFEHLLRHLDDIGFEGLFGQWKPMFFYNMYPVAQFGFSILVLMVLYFMTFNASKMLR